MIQATPTIGPRKLVGMYVGCVASVASKRTPSLRGPRRGHPRRRSLDGARHGGGPVLSEHAVIAHEAPRGVAARASGAIVRRAVASACSEGMALCDSVDVPFDRVARDVPLTTKMIRAATKAQRRLRALRGAPGARRRSRRQHAGAPRRLTSSKGIEITSAAAYEWGRFPGSPRPTAQHVARSACRSCTRSTWRSTSSTLGYELRAQATRAHFVDASRYFEDVVRSAGAANLDNALEQFLAHHIRSLELASRGQADGGAARARLRAPLLRRRVRGGSPHRGRLEHRQRSGSGGATISATRAACRSNGHSTASLATQRHWASPSSWACPLLAHHRRWVPRPLTGRV